MEEGKQIDEAQNNGNEAMEVAQEQTGQSETDAKGWAQALIDSLPGKDKNKNESIAAMPVAKQSDRYNMRHPNRGKAVIFNHMNFSNGQSQRKGSERDEQRLKTCLASVGFEVEVHRDIRRRDFYDVIDKLEKYDHSNNDCLLIVVLSHGEQNKIFCEDSDYPPEHLWDPFTADRCPTLAGKPKIFLIQACRGDQLDGGTILQAQRTQTDSRSKEEKFYIVPNRADVLVVYSTAPGYYSWRNTSEGSWFIQSLTNVVNTYKDQKDFLSMMTMVAREVALNFESCTPGNARMDQKKQVPMISSTLIREIYL